MLLINLKRYFFIFKESEFKMKKLKTYRIYGLVVDDRVFYVGVTSNHYLSKRKSQHIFDARNRPAKNPVKAKFINKCLAQNKEISIIEIDQTQDISMADRLEQYYIKNLKGLLNGPTKHAYSQRRTFYQDMLITGQLTLT